LPDAPAAEGEAGEGHGGDCEVFGGTRLERRLGGPRMRCG
jgi:hypothetical protein